MMPQWTQITATQSDDAFFEDYIRLALACEPPKLPDRTLRLGAVQAGWFPTVPGTAHIFASGGTPLDRFYACQIIEEQLAGHDIRRAQYSLDWDHSDTQLTEEVDAWVKTADARYASWQDIEAGAKRLIQGGKVHMLRNGAQFIASHVEGEHGDYECEIQRLDPNSKSISLWNCSCPWDTYAWLRTRKWKRLEGRPCKHILATFWTSLSMPLDEEIGPESEGPQEPQAGGAGGTMQPEGVPQPAGPAPGMEQVPGGGTGMVPPAGTPGPQKPGLPNQTAPSPVPTGPVPGQAPEPQPLIPQYPMDPSLQPAINPVSVPGQKPSGPLNPLQWPGGTFSSVRQSATQQFVNGDLVQLKQSDFGQTVGLGAGETKEVPMNSIGEVMGVDPLGLVNVYYAGPQAEAGRMEPHGVTAWHWNKDLIPRPDLKKPGPAIMRRRR
jgi:hypothetical protein